MQRYKSLFTELSKVDEVSQNALDLVKKIKEDDSLKMDALKFYRQIEKTLKEFTEKHYSNKNDIESFSKAITEYCMKEITTKPQDYTAISLSTLLAAATSLANTAIESEKEEEAPEEETSTEEK